VAAAEAMRDAIPAAQLKQLSGLARIPTIEGLEAVTEAMRRFLLHRL
jgi:hypothetical protein